MNQITVIPAERAGGGEREPESSDHGGRAFTSAAGYWFRLARARPYARSRASKDALWPSPLGRDDTATLHSDLGAFIRRRTLGSADHATAWRAIQGAVQRAGPLPSLRLRSS